jgi:RNA polymerase primary sigma factor
MPRKKPKTSIDSQAALGAAAVLRLVEEPSSYLRLLTRERLLAADEEAMLANAAHGGDQHAKDRLIEANMRLVVNIAKHYHSPVVPFEDLVQEGAIGLMTACDRYDPERGFRFSTYATHWIKQAISRAIDNKARAIRVPAHVSEVLRRIERARAALLKQGGEEPAIEQLAIIVGMSPRKVAAYLLAGQDPLSLDMLVGGEESVPLSALVNDTGAADPQDSLIRRETEIEIAQMLDALNEREQMVMRRRLGFDDDDSHVLQEIGDELHISRERVRQIEAQALKRLRAAARRRQLGDAVTE